MVPPDAYTAYALFPFSLHGTSWASAGRQTEERPCVHQSHLLSHAQLADKLNKAVQAAQRPPLRIFMQVRPRVHTCPTHPVQRARMGPLGLCLACNPVVIKLCPDHKMEIASIQLPQGCYDSLNTNRKACCTQREPGTLQSLAGVSSARLSLPAATCQVYQCCHCRAVLLYNIACKAKSIPCVACIKLERSGDSLTCKANFCIPCHLIFQPFTKLNLAHSHRNCFGVHSHTNLSMPGQMLVWAQQSQTNPGRSV